MQRIPVSLVLSLVVAACLSTFVSAQEAGRIESMKLLAPDIGWASTSQKVFWTTDGGAQWKDITPKLNHKRQMVSSVFFLDASAGWVLLKCSDDRDVLADEGCLDLASTTDSGETWSTLHEKFSVPFSKEYLRDSTGFSGRSWLQFIDSQHGWELLDIATNSANPSAGEMLRTSDGGRTWTPTKDAPTSDHFLFVTPTNGWIAGGKDQDLFVTRDAGDSWQKVLLPSAAGTQPNLGESISLPVFKNEKEGLLSVRYSVGPVAGPDLSTVVLFATGDGGRSWKQDRTLARVPSVHCSDIVGSALIAVHSDLLKSQKTRVQVYAEGRDGKAAQNVALVSSLGAATELSFLSQSEGWLDMSDKLLVTKDAGKAWVDITPRRTIAHGWHGSDSSQHLIDNAR